MKLLKQLSTLAILEGISYLMFAVTIPLKYMLEITGPNQIVGMLHGVLFLAYCLWAIFVSKEQNWNIKTTCITLAASLLPIATFIVDSKIIKPEIDQLKN